MVKLNKKLNTKVFAGTTKTAVKLYSTKIVEFTAKEIALDFGGYATVTTRRRMNQVSREYILGFSVFQHDYGQYVSYRGEFYNFDSKVVLDRETSNVYRLDAGNKVKLNPLNEQYKEIAA
jgi:hypothetical protein